MRAYCDTVPGPKMANLVEEGDTPMLPPAELEDIGYTFALYPITLLLAGMRAMEEALAAMKTGQRPAELATFEHLRDVVGFPAYYEAEKKYATD